MLKLFSRLPGAGRGERAGRQRPLLDTRVFDNVLANGSVTDRQALACQLAAFVRGREAKDPERRLVTPYLHRLLQDKDMRVRQACAESLTEDAHLDADSVFLITADAEAIALPFLRRAKALDAARQVAIFKAGDEKRREALAQRAAVSDRLMTLIAREGELPVVLALLDNGRVRIDGDNLKRIYARFRDVPAVTERLLARKDLPAEIRIVHVRTATERVRTAILKGELPASVAIRKAVEDTEERALADILISLAKDKEGLRAAMRFMAGRGLLTAAVILRAAVRGHVAVLLAALGVLAGASSRRLERIAKKGSKRALRALYKKSDLPEAALPLVEAVFDVAQKHGDAEAGVSEATFGREVLSWIMAADNDLSVAEKARLAEILAQLADEETRPLAARLGKGLLKAA